MIKALEYILTRFPDQRAKIINLYNTDDDFKTLCEDYFTSVQAIEKCRTSATKGREVENEYLHVNLELEKEILNLFRTYLSATLFIYFI